MLIELFGRNFRSFRDEFRLSMVAADIDRDNPRGIIEVELEGDDEPLRLLRCAAIYGPNASGKSAITLAAKAIEYLLWTSAKASSDEPIAPYEPFLLDEHSAREPVMLGLKAVVNGRVYEYAVEFTDSSVLAERLVQLDCNDVVPLFERSEQVVEGDWKSHPLFGLLTDSFRPNALLLSLADSLAPGLAQGLAVAFRRLLSRFDPTSVPWFDTGRGTPLAGLAHSDRKGFGNWLVDCLRSADIGVLDYETEEIPDAQEPDTEEASEHRRRPRATRFKIKLLHSGKQRPVLLPFWQESKGTQKIAELAPFMYELTHGVPGRAYFIDEIGASMHPDLLRSMIRHFNCEVPQERVSGQLIFATHETSLIDAEAKDAILRRDQVYLTEKDNDGASRLYSVADFKERNNLNLRRRYLQGRYGALPSLGSFGD